MFDLLKKSVVGSSAEGTRIEAPKGGMEGAMPILQTIFDFSFQNGAF